MKALELATLTNKEYELISNLIYEKFGITLGDQKRSLIIGRLNKVLRQHGFTSFMQYYEYMNSDNSGQALEGLIDQISTNHTFFWRENGHFIYLVEQVLPGLMRFMEKQRSREIRVWCAGCSSGEEPYTIAMLLDNHLAGNLSRWDIGILATDISSKVLDEARAGIYSTENVSKLPETLLKKYFAAGKEGAYAVKERIAKMVTFKRLNLMNEDLPFKGKFQIIFCRNVMIYFDKETRESLVERFARFQPEGGYLFIGHSESLGRGNSLYRYVKPAIYRRGGQYEW
jgi:chemotaxis protein methyltransferase CheR